jgi:hypothetical protein
VDEQARRIGLADGKRMLRRGHDVKSIPLRIADPPGEHGLTMELDGSFGVAKVLDPDVCQLGRALEVPCPVRAFNPSFLAPAGFLVFESLPKGIPV